MKLYFQSRDLPCELYKHRIGRPHIIFSNDDGSTNITFTFTADVLTNEMIDEVKSSLEQTITKMTAVDTIISSSVIDHEQKIGYFDFISPAIDGDVYTIMFIFSLDEQLILGAFNCLHFDMASWTEVVVQMLKSIRVHKKGVNDIEQIQ
jgi:hypothetical protein